MSNTWRVIAYVGAPGFLFGVLTGLYLNAWKVVEVRFEVTAGEILNAVVTVALALVVADYLSKRATNLRVEKDLLLQDCADALRATAAVREFARKFRRVDGTSEERREVLPLLDDAFNALQTLETDLSLCRESIGKVDLKPVRGSLFRYKAALTRGPFPQNPLDDQTYLESERKYTDCANKLASVRFELNRR